MTKKDYTLIARCIRKIESPTLRQQVALEFARALSAENPRFSTPTFLAATNPVEEYIFTSNEAYRQESSP